MKFMKNICNRCSNVFQADDMTIHYITSENGIEIVAICPSCLEKYLQKTRKDSNRKEDENERNKMKRKW